jgi:AcrR family transcriptional regulator
MEGMTQEDRRIRRTRDALSTALVDLVLERGYEAVRVEDITTRANVGKATFYTHFPTKEALYDRVVADVLGELRESMTPIDREEPGFTGEPVRRLFDHAAAHPRVYRMILRGEGDGRGLRALIDDWATEAQRIFSSRIEAQRAQPRVNLQVVARAWAGEQVSVLLWWLEAPAPRPELAQVVETLIELSRRGRFWASGFDAAV